MEQSKNKKKRSVSEILEQSDIELTGGWPKLASLIFAYEGIEWEDASIKARKLLKDSRVDALNYIKEIRDNFEPPQKIKPKITKKKVRREREFVNYRRLLKNDCCKMVGLTTAVKSLLGLPLRYSVGLALRINSLKER